MCAAYGAVVVRFCPAGWYITVAVGQQALRFVTTQQQAIAIAESLAEVSS